MKLKDIVFLEDYFFGKQLGINCMDFNKSSYFNKTDFFKNQFDYIDNFIRQNEQTQPQCYQNNIGYFEDNFEIIPTFDFLENPNQREDTLYFYQINIYSWPADSFDNDSVFNKIPYKIIEHLKYNPNVYLIINASSEGYLPYESFHNLNNWLLEKELKLDKTFFIHANYRISEYALDYKEKYGTDKCVNVIPYLWSIPFFHNKLHHDNFPNETLYKQNFNVGRKKSFNLLTREQKPHRTQLLCDLHYLDLIENNNVSYDFYLHEGYEDVNHIKNNWIKMEQWFEQDSPKFQRYWKILEDLIEKAPKKTIDYERLWDVRGEGMETDIPYKDTLFTVVAESFFYEMERIGYVSEKVIKPILHQHPFIVLSTSGTLTWLHNMGFKTFGETGYVDETYDCEEDPEKRYKMVLKEIINLSQLTTEQRETFMYNCKEIIEHNYNHLKNFDMVKYNRNLMWYFQKARTNLDFLL